MYQQLDCQASYPCYQKPTNPYSMTQTDQKSIQASNYTFLHQVPTYLPRIELRPSFKLPKSSGSAPPQHPPNAPHSSTAMTLITLGRSFPHTPALRHADVRSNARPRPPPSHRLARSPETNMTVLRNCLGIW